MSEAGRKIIDGLREAVDGGFSAVTIDGQRWVREARTVVQARLMTACQCSCGVLQQDVLHEGDTEIGRAMDAIGRARFPDVWEKK